ncbi:hypothetical protein NUW54_g8230 [Trametes sanguinea]|uniref:Uncharacterized protein n=1 Tax=Trametes sanguinea TaxID=158606 RepID=A0ACC1PFX1_9APHY|nr:hypothetical protein NUW54_g8230 [Trametes sanguinea]
MTRVVFVVVQPLGEFPVGQEALIGRPPALAGGRYDQDVADADVAMHDPRSLISVLMCYKVGEIWTYRGTPSEEAQPPSRQDGNDDASSSGRSPSFSASRHSQPLWSSVQRLPPCCWFARSGSPEVPPTAPRAPFTSCTTWRPSIRQITLFSHHFRFAAFQAYKVYAENCLGLKIKATRDDKGGEYIGREYNDFCAQHGIQRQHTEPDEPHQNGVAERANRTIAEGATALLAQSKLPPSFWGHAVSTFVHTHNHMPTSALGGAIPYTAWKGKGRKPDVSYFRTFGCLVYVLVRKKDRKALELHSHKCILLNSERLLEFLCPYQVAISPTGRLHCLLISLLSIRRSLSPFSRYRSLRTFNHLHCPGIEPGTSSFLFAFVDF